MINRRNEIKGTNSDFSYDVKNDQQCKYIKVLIEELHISY